MPLPENLKQAQDDYTSAFRVRLKEAGQAENASELAEAAGHKLTIEILPVRKEAFLLRDLPDPLRDLIHESYGFPVAVTKISLGQPDALIELVPQDVLRLAKPMNNKSAQVYGDAMYPPVSPESPTAIFSKDMRFTLMDAEYSIGTFPKVTVQGTKNSRDALWTPHQLRPMDIYGLTLLVQHSEQFLDASYRISIHRVGAPKPLDFSRHPFWGLR